MIHYFELLEFDDESCGNCKRSMKYNTDTCVPLDNSSIMVNNITEKSVTGNLYKTDDCTGDGSSFSTVLTKCSNLHDKYVKFSGNGKEIWIIVLFLILFLGAILFTLWYYFTKYEKRRIPTRFMPRLG